MPESCPKVDPDPKKRRHHKSARTENSVQNGPVDKFTALTATLFVTISVFMSRGHFPATFGQLMDSFWTTCGQLVDNLWATFGQQKWAIRNVSKNQDPNLSYILGAF